MPFPSAGPEQRHGRGTDRPAPDPGTYGGAARPPGAVFAVGGRGIAFNRPTEPAASSKTHRTPFGAAQRRDSATRSLRVCWGDLSSALTPAEVGGQLQILRRWGRSRPARRRSLLLPSAAWPFCQRVRPTAIVSKSGLHLGAAAWPQLACRPLHRLPGERMGPHGNGPLMAPASLPGCGCQGGLTAGGFAPCVRAFGTGAINDGKWLPLPARPARPGQPTGAWVAGGQSPAEGPWAPLQRLPPWGPWSGLRARRGWKGQAG